MVKDQDRQPRLNRDFRPGSIRKKCPLRPWGPSRGSTLRCSRPHRYPHECPSTRWVPKAGSAVNRHPGKSITTVVLIWTSPEAADPIYRGTERCSNRRRSTPTRHNSSVYVAAKHGVVGLSKNAALEHAAQDVRVNSVGPAFIQTPLLNENLDQGTLDALSGMHPIQGLGQPQEVADLVAILLSGEASFITGSYHLVDSGYTAQ